MPPAYLRAPTMLKATAEVYVPGCTNKEAKTKKTALAAQRRRGDGPPYRCMTCGQWHNHPRDAR